MNGGRQEGIDPGRVAEILVTLGGGGRRGSGYRVSATAVLTAAHVVAGASRVRVRFDADQPGEWAADAEVAWANPVVDAAVLTLASDQAQVSEAVPDAGFGRVAATDAVLACSAVGFPRFKLRRDTPAANPDDSPSQYRDTAHAVGKVAVLSNRREGTLEVTVDPPERDNDPGRSPWEGMSGAALWSAGQIIGVITEHHRSDGLGRLAASRVDRWYTQLDKEKRRALRRLLPVLPATADGFTEVVPATAADHIQAGYLAQVRDIAPVQLFGRDPELAELVRFCAGPDPYAWWQAAPWAGKSALAAWFVLHPPAGTVIASFFVTSRLTGQADSDAFTEAMTEQLAAIAGEPVSGTATPAGRDRERRRLLEAAAARAAASQLRLVLVIDGLDEDMGAVPGSGQPSIAALLPRRPDPAVRVLVTSRPHPGVPGDVPADHPLRLCVPSELRPSSLASDIQFEAKTELLQRLHGDQLQVDVIGFITVSGGGLTLGELAELTGERRFRLESKLGSVFGRSLLTRGTYDPVGEAPQDRVYLFAHETLRATAEQELAGDLRPCRRDLDDWAERYRAGGWPDGTPRYLLRPYGRMLAAAGDYERLAEVATDTGRQDQMLVRTFSDAAALAEIAAAQQLILAKPRPDLAALARLAIAQDRLNHRNQSLPPELAGLWARLGQADRAESLARSSSGPGSQARALCAVAAALAGVSQDRAALLAAEAGRMAAMVPDGLLRTYALYDVAEGLAGAGFWDIASDTARSVTDPADRADALCAVAALAAGQPELAAGLAGEALELARSGPDGSGDDFVRGRVTNALTAACLWDWASEAAGSAGSERQRGDALRTVVDGLVRAGHRERARDTARGIAGGTERAAALAAVALAAASDDRDLAVALATESEQAARSDRVFALSAAAACRALAPIVAALSHLDPAHAEALASEVQERATGEADPEVRVRLIATAGRAWATVRPDHATALARQALDLAMAIGDQERQIGVLSITADELAAGGLWQSARQAAQAIPSPGYRAWVLGILAGQLADAGQWEQAEETCLAIEIPDQRSLAECPLTRNLARAQRWDQAERIAGSIADPGQKSKARSAIVTSLAEAGLADRAEQVARLPDSPAGDRVLMLVTVAGAAVKLDPQRALALASESEQIARTPLASLSQARALAAAARALAASTPAASDRDRGTAHQLSALAGQAARELPALADRVRGLSAVTAVVAVLDPQAARGLAAEVISTAGLLPAAFDQALTVRQVVDDLLAAGLCAAARDAALAIHDPGGQAGALAAAAAAVAGIDREAARAWADEAVVAAAAADPGALEPSEALRTVAAQLLRAGLAGRARRAAEAIPDAGRRARAFPGAMVLTEPDPAARDRARPGLAAALAQLAAAQAAESSRPDSEAGKLAELAAMIAAAGPEPERAAACGATARTIQYPRDRAMALLATAILLSTAAPDRSLALAVEAVQAAGMIRLEYDRASVLGVLAPGLAAAGCWEQAKLAALVMPGQPGQPGQPGRTIALQDLVAALLTAGEWDLATAAASGIEGQPDRVSAVRDIVAGLTAGHHWEQAEETARTMADGAEQARLRGTILAGLVAADQAGDREQAGPGPTRRDRIRALAAAVLVSPHWPGALPALGLLDPAGLSAAGGLLVSLQNG